MGFRRATPEDLPWMLEMAARITDFFFADRLPRALQDPRCQVFVAEEDGQCRAFAELEFSLPGHAWLQWMRVDPNFQGGGLGTALTTFLTERARLLGARVVGLTTMDDNLRVHRIMTRLGFRHHTTEWSCDDPAQLVMPESHDQAGGIEVRAVSPPELDDLIPALVQFDQTWVVRHPGLEECFTDWRTLSWHRLAASGSVWIARNSGTARASGLLYEFYRKRWTTFWAPLFGDREALMSLYGLAARIHRLKGHRRMTVSLPVNPVTDFDPSALGLLHGVRTYQKGFD